jgi:hypothetical protein
VTLLWLASLCFLFESGALSVRVYLGLCGVSPLGGTPCLPACKLPTQSAIALELLCITRLYAPAPACLHVSILLPSAYHSELFLLCLV